MRIYSRNKGYSLMEMLVVLAIVSAFVGLAVVWRPFDGAVGVMQKEAALLSAALRKTRARAIAQGRARDFVLDLETGRYGAAGRDGALSARWRIEATGASRFSEGGKLVIRFFPNGASSGGAIDLSRGEASMHVRVDWMTGRVRIAEDVR